MRNASISVVRKILDQAAVDGFHNKQHLYVTFFLAHKDVQASEALRANVNNDDNEMTVVLQYEFWDLKTDEFGFAVSLAFEHDDETLYIPFAALISVSDPSEKFSLEFIPDLTDTKPSSAQRAIPKLTNVIQLDSFRNLDK
jgi:hypothetical protein